MYPNDETLKYKGMNITNNHYDYYNDIQSIVYTYPIWSNLFNKILLNRLEIEIFGNYLGLKVFTGGKYPIINTDNYCDNDSSLIMDYFLGEHCEENILNIVNNWGSFPTIDTILQKGNYNEH